MKNLDLKVLKKFHERLNQQKAKVSSVGTIFKQRRIELNLKQSFVAYGICSVSHLSKIENNQTVPQSDIVKHLIKRLHLTAINIHQPQDEAFLHEMLTSVFYQNVVILDRLIEDKKTKSPISTQLLAQYHTAILKKDLRLTSTLSEKLKTIYRTFNAEEFIVWILGFMSEATLKHDYQYAISLSRVLNEEVIVKRAYQALFHRTLYLAHLHLGHASIANVHGRLLESHLDYLIHQKTSEMLQLTIRYFLIDKCVYSVQKFMNKDDHKPYLPEHHNLHALIQCELAAKLNQTIPNVTLNQDFKDEWYYRLALFLAEHTDYDARNDFKEQNHYNAPFKSMYKLSKLKNPMRRYRFLKDETILMLYKHQESRFLNQFTDELNDYLIQHSRYKESLALKARTEHALAIPNEL